jgi:transcriptional regulator with XRE-family HTH domain
VSEVQGIETEGRRLLNAWFEADSDRNGARLAKIVGVSQPAVSMWRRGVWRPEQPHRDILFELCGIPQLSWELPEERERREKALANVAALGATGTDGGR